MSTGSGRPEFAPGGRRLARPAGVWRCPVCGEFTGRGYPTCPDCVAMVDSLWLADWYALLTERAIEPGGRAEHEFAEHVLADDIGAHPWTCVDWAIDRIQCPACRAVLGNGPIGCVLCRIADETRWAWEDAAPTGALTRNEHALRAARVVLRSPHRYRAMVVLTWRLALPFVLTGEICAPPRAPWIKAYLRAGRYAELAAADSYEQLAGTPDLPWR